MNFTDAEMETYVLRPGDIVLNEASGSPGEVGKPAIWSGEIEECAFQNTLIRVRPGERVESRFLVHYFRHLARSGQFVEHSRGVGIHHIGRARLASWPTPLPPVDEQRRIVEILEDHLSRLDAASVYLALGKRRLSPLRRAALAREFTPGPSFVTLEDVVESISAGKSFGSSNAPAEPDEWGIVKVSAMTWGEFRPEENKAVRSDRVDPRFEIRKGDLLVSRANTNEYVGASVLVGPVRPKLLLSDKSLRVVPKSDINSEWLWRALQAPGARQQISSKATGTKDSMRNISQQALLKIRLPRADEAEQVAAVRAFQAVNESLVRMTQELSAAEGRVAMLRKAQLAAAFSGQLTGHASDLSRAGDLAAT